MSSDDKTPGIGASGCTCTVGWSADGPWPEWDINCPIHGHPERYCTARDGRGPHDGTLGFCYLNAGHDGPHMAENIRTGISYTFGSGA